MGFRQVSIVGVLWGSLWAASVGAAPHAPAHGTEWRLDVQFRDPQRITLQLPGDAVPVTYWYVVYQVTNDTGQDRQFYPSFELVTDTLQVVEGGANVAPAVYDAVMARHRSEFSFIAPPMRVTGPLLQGEANARASVAVFRNFDASASRFVVFASGFSGKIERVANPKFNIKERESETNRRDFLLRQTLAIEYDLPGDPTTRHRAVPVRRHREWVMR